MTTDLVLLGLCAGFGLVLVATGLTRRSSLVEEMQRYGPEAVLVARPSEVASRRRNRNIVVHAMISGTVWRSQLAIATSIRLKNTVNVSP